jgi:diguanylate cyclase (GGDEF)-like protein
VLTVFRSLAFLAPGLILATLAMLLPELVALGLAERPNSLLLVAVAGCAGAAIMAAVSWIAASRRLRTITKALDSVRSGELWRGMPEGGTTADRDVARALNAVAEAMAQIEARASRDRLTGVANRETLLAALVGSVERAARSGRPLAVAFVDVDRFKAINDAYGHASGDSVLRQVAALVSRSVRAGDVVGRYGGEEFMVILPDTDAEGARRVAERLRTTVMRSPLRIAGGEDLQTTVSVGIAAGAGAELRLDVLVAEADAAMYLAKSRGRNQTRVFAELGADAPFIAARAASDRQEVAAAIGQWAGMTMIQGLASLLAPQPAHRGRPSDMIAATATGLAARMGVPDAEIEQIRLASLLHDAGKLAVPPEILDKSDPLTETEWHTVTEHARLGETVIEQATSLRAVIPMILHHHERYDGSGYPDGLTGRAIPIGARIVAIADAYQAMVRDRPHQKAISHDAALAELQRHAGSQFDPDLVAAFCELYAHEVPADGLEEVYRLHEHARGGLRQLRAHRSIRGSGHRAVGGEDATDTMQVAAG